MNSSSEQPLPPDRGTIPEDASSRPSCLLIHGLGGGVYELAPIVETLEGMGLRTLAPTLPGHEGPGPIMPTSLWRDWVVAVEAAFEALVAEGKPVVVVGFSTGGTLALHLAARRQVARQVLLAPFLSIRFSRLIPFAPSLYLRPIARVLPNLRRRPPAVRDRSVRKQLAASSLFRTFSLGATLSALELIEQVKPLISAITTPTLILQGRRDTVVEPRDAAWLRDRLGSADKSLVILPHSDHLLAFDRDRDEVISRTLDFVLGRGAKSPETRRD